MTDSNEVEESAIRAGAAALPSGLNFNWAEVETAIRAALASLPTAPVPEGWRTIESGPPRHKDLLFLCKGGRIYSGRACYGMHAPYWTANTPGHSYVLNDTETVTHWRLASELLPPVEKS